MCTVCAFAVASCVFDADVMAASGIGAHFVRLRGCEMAPRVLGPVLGALPDNRLRRGPVRVAGGRYSAAPGGGMRRLFGAPRHRARPSPARSPTTKIVRRRPASRHSIATLP